MMLPFYAANLDRCTGNEEPLVNAWVDWRWCCVVTLGNVELAWVGAVSGLGNGGVGPDPAVSCYAPLRYSH